MSSLPGWAYRTKADSGDLETVGYAWTQPWDDPGMFAVLLGSDADVEEAFLTETLQAVRT